MIENDFLNTDEEIKLRAEVKDFVKSVDPELLRKMDKNEIDYPYEFLHNAAERNLLGLRFAKEYGGSGHCNTGGVEASPASFYGKFDYSLSITLPPLAVLVFKPEEDNSDTSS